MSTFVRIYITVGCFSTHLEIFCGMNYNQLVASRRSHRSFAKGELEGDQIMAIMRAALMSPTSRNNRSWQFVVVEAQSDLDKLSDIKEHGSDFIKEADLAVVVLGCPDRNDCWVEDGSIAAFSMQLQAEDLGLASCWVQVRGRRLSDGTTACEVTRGILGIPPEMEVLCVIAFGKKDKALKPHDEESLRWENVHLEKY